MLIGSSIQQPSPRSGYKLCGPLGVLPIIAYERKLRCSRAPLITINYKICLKKFLRVINFSNSNTRILWLYYFNLANAIYDKDKKTEISSFLKKKKKEKTFLNSPHPRSLPGTPAYTLNATPFR